MKPDSPARGRPPFEGETADAVIHIRCTKSEKARWTNQARAERKKLSQWIKEKLG